MRDMGPGVGAGEEYGTLPVILGSLDAERSHKFAVQEEPRRNSCGS